MNSNSYNTSDIDLAVDVAGVKWNNPVTTASGTFSVKDSPKLYDISRLGAVTTKGISVTPWSGNPTPRIAETPCGMLNSVGLENPGIQHYLENDLPDLRRDIAENSMETEIENQTKVIANLAGHSLEEYCTGAELLVGADIDMVELNISCPNIECGGIGFGTSPDMTESVVREVKAIVDKPLIVKLTPNVTDIGLIATTAEKAGADAISMINTLMGMDIDAKKRQITLANTTGGLSGPAIKPVALRMVYDVTKKVSIPVIGMGGIMSGEDAAEFFMAGVSAVAVGTAALIDTQAPVRVLEELKDFMAANGFKNIKELKNGLQK